MGVNYQCLRGQVHAIAPAEPPGNPHSGFSSTRAARDSLRRGRRALERASRVRGLLMLLKKAGPVVHCTDYSGGADAG